MKFLTGKIFLYLIICSFPAGNAFGQSSLRYEHFTSEKGLSGNYILTLAHDSVGYIWIGTNTGLNRYDGNGFKKFFHEDNDSLSLSHDNVNKLYVDRRGTLWIGTRSGLDRYNPIQENFTHCFSRKDKPVGVFAICADKEERLWLGTNEGLKIFDPHTNKITDVNIKDSLNFFQSSMARIFIDDKEQVWLGSASNGLRVIAQSSMQPLPAVLKQLPDSLVNAGVEDINQTADGTMWFASSWGFCAYANGRLQRFYREELNLPNLLPSASSMCETTDGNMWFGLYQSTPTRFSSKVFRNQFYNGIGQVNIKTRQVTWHLYKSEENDNLTWGYVTCLTQDKYGILWIGTSRGLNKLNMRNQTFHVYSQFPNLNYNLADNIYSIYKESDTSIWLGTDGGFLKSFNPLTNTYTKIDFPGLSSLFNGGSVYALAPVGKNQIAIGTQQQGLMLLDRKSGKLKTLVPFPPSVFNLGISSLAFDSVTQSIWIGWMGAGLMNYNFGTQKITTYACDGKNKNGICSNQVTSLLLDKKRNLWIGTGDRLNVVVPGNTEGNGLDRLNIETGEFTHYAFNPSDSTSVCSNNITCLAEDANGGIWAGSLNGLSYLAEGSTKFRRFTQKNGLPGNFITQLCFDNAQNLWIGTWANGLCRYDVRHNLFKYFLKKDGLQDMRFNANAVYKDTEGNLLFGGVRGFNAINPQEIPAHESSGPAVISEISINGKPNALESPAWTVTNLTLPYNQSNVQFRFFSPDYSTDKRTFLYKLEGFDPDWQNAGAEQVAKYTRIKPGDYTFKVKTVNETGSGSETAIAVVITPPFWQTWWFYLLTVVILIGAIFFFIRVRLASFRNRQKELEEKVALRTVELREQKEIAEQHRARAEQSEKFKQQFLANMSHEIRTPMNAVMGMTELVLQSPLNEKQRSYLQSVKKSSDSLLHIINDILDLSKIEAGKIELEHIDFSVSEVLHHVKDLLHTKAEEKNLQMLVHVHPDVPDVSVGDPLRLTQVLMNLAGNALKFTDKGSVVLEVKMSGKKMLFSVIDTGIGIPAEKQQSIFESFSQAHSSDSRLYGGTGLGLSISRQFISLMGGTLKVESTAGSGSTFYFEIELPVGSKEKLEQQFMEQQVDGSILNGLKILLVDDNADNRVVARDTIELSAQVQVTEAVNGKDALEKLTAHAFDLVLMDVQMPVMDGYEATRRIRGLSAPQKDVPIIALTASVIRSDLDKCRAAGMNDYVPKPFQTHQFIATIAKVTGRQVQYKKSSALRAAAQPSSNGKVDLTYLEKFCEGDRTRMQKYINIFVQSSQPFIDKLNAALGSGDFEEIANQVHGFKTKYIMMGMHKAAQLSAALEAGCRQKSVSHDVLRSDTQLLIRHVAEAATALKGETL